jgi:flagellar motor switch protein FliG
MELERAYQNQPVQQAAPSDDEDLMTKGELKKMLAEKEMIINQQLRSTQLKSQFSDYDQVVNKEVFDEIKRDHPEIGQAIMNSRDPDLLAYVIGKNSDAYRKRTASKQQQQADALKVMENSQKPGSITQASTGGGALSNANYYESMTPDQFEQHVAKVKRRHNWMDD